LLLCNFCFVALRIFEQSADLVDFIDNLRPHYAACFFMRGNISGASLTFQAASYEIA